MKVVCLDAGHGGHDCGALGISGLKESDMALSVCLLARDILSPWVNVVMTRDDDTYVELSERAHIANLANSNLFVSYHFNSASSIASGWEIFTTKKSNNSDIFANMVATRHREQFPYQKERGLKESNFTVIAKANCPAILVEGEFIHTPEGESFISDFANRQRMALAVANGVFDYLGIEPVTSVPTPLTLQERVLRLELEAGLA